MLWVPLFYKQLNRGHTDESIGDMLIVWTQVYCEWYDIDHRI